MPPLTRPHRRLNPLRRSWVLVSPQRTSRPWQGETTRPTPPPTIPYDPTCYLCPGNPRVGGITNPPYTATFAFNNDFQALLPPDDSQAESDGLLTSEPESGLCRVVCFHPNHSLTLSHMQPADIAEVVRVWIEETRTLAADPNLNYVQIFENRGGMMGSSNPHPHCQIWATHHIPEEPALEQAAQQAYFAEHNRTLLADYLKQEIAAAQNSDQHRLVCQNDSFAALVPYWATWPFEAILIAKTPTQRFTDLTPQQTTDLADILKRTTTRYDNLFSTPFPYTMGFHQAPVDGADHPEWHFHAHFYPPLLRSAEIRKFMVGFEMLGMPQRDITPESAAALLRAASEQTLI